MGNTVFQIPRVGIQLNNVIAYYNLLVIIIHLFCGNLKASRDYYDLR